jgi:hypothetical protein
MNNYRPSYRPGETGGDAVTGFSVEIKPQKVIYASYIQKADHYPGKRREELQWPLRRQMSPSAIIIREAG